MRQIGCVTVVTLPALIGSALFPIMSSFVDRPGDELRKSITTMFRIGAFVGFLPSILVAALPELVIKLYGAA